MGKNEAIERLNAWVEFHREMAQMFVQSWIGSDNHHTFAADTVRQTVLKLDLGRYSLDDVKNTFELELANRPPKVVAGEPY